MAHNPRGGFIDGHPASAGGACVRRPWGYDNSCGLKCRAGRICFNAESRQEFERFYADEMLKLKAASAAR